MGTLLWFYWGEPEVSRLVLINPLLPLPLASPVCILALCPLHTPASSSKRDSLPGLTIGATSKSEWKPTLNKERDYCRTNTGSSQPLKQRAHCNREAMWAKGVSMVLQADSMALVLLDLSLPSFPIERGEHLHSWQLPWPRFHSYIT